MLLVLAVFILLTTFEVWLSWQNLRYAERDMPSELAGIYTPERFAQSKEYLRANTYLGTVETIVATALFVGFWLAGGFEWLDVWARSWNFDVYQTGLVYFASLATLKFFTGLPFVLYHTFILEERFGFNRTTAKIFLVDNLKSILLALILGAPLLWITQWFFVTAGTWAWLYLWVVMALFQLGILVIAPVWIMPLFFSFKPLEAGVLRSMIEEYAKKVGYELKGIFIIDGSRRSNKANAFFTGFGRTRRIALFDTLVSRATPQEILAVLAHEVGHAKLGHMKKGLILSLGSSALMLFALQHLMTWEGLLEIFKVSTFSVYVALVLASILYGPLSLIFSIVTNSFSRKHEYQADAYAAETHIGADLVSALKKLSDVNLSNINPHPWKVFLEYSHPTLLQRIRALNNR